MTESESEILRKVEDIRIALVGDMTSKNPGALHLLATVVDSLERLEENTKLEIQSLRTQAMELSARVRKLEDEKQRRVGIMLACSTISSLVAFAIATLIAWAKSKGDK